MSIINKIFLKFLFSLILLVGFFAFVPLAHAAEFYWYGGSGNWSDYTNHWSSNSGNSPAAPKTNVPTSADNVYFDSNSFTGAGQTVTIDAASYCKDMNWTGATNSPTLSISGASGLGTYGNVTFIGAMTISVPSGTSYLVSYGGNYTFNGVTVGVNFNLASGTTTLMDTCNFGSKPIYQYGSASLNTNGQTVTCSSFTIGGTGSKTLTLGSSTVNCTSWNYTGSNLTLDAGTSTIKITGTGAFQGGGLTTYNKVELNDTAHTISGSNTFASLTRTGTATKTDTVTFTSGTTQTITGTLNLSGNSSTNRLLVQASTLGSPATVNAVNVAASNVDFMDITGTSPANYALSFDGTDYVNVGDPVSGSLDFGTSDFTAEGWFRFSQSSTAQYFLGKRSTDSTTGWVILTPSSDTGYLWAGINDGSGNIFTSGTGALQKNVWHHFVAVYDRDAYLTLYVDGSVYGTPLDISGKQNSVSNARNFVIGSRDGFGYPVNNGLIDEVRIYSRTLTAAEALQHYNNQFLDETGLAGLWHFSENTGTATADSSANGNTGTFGAESAAPAWATYNPWDLSASTNIVGDCGGNTGISFPAGVTQTWNGTTGLWSTASKWTSRVPLPQDDVNAPTTTATTITVDMPRIGKSITFTGTGTGTVTLSNAIECYGSFTLNAGMTYTTGSDMYNYFRGRSSGMPVGGWEIKSDAPSFRAVYLAAPSGIYVLKSNITITRNANAIFLVNGTLDFNDYNVNITGGLGRISVSGTETRSLYMGDGTITFSGTTANNIWVATTTTNLSFYAENSTVVITNSTTSAKSFDINGLTFNNVTVQGAGDYALTVTGSNTFNTFTVDRSQAAKTIKFAAGTTQRFSNFVSPVSGSTVLTINSDTTGTHTLEKTGGGTISLDYLNIQHSIATIATPATTWYAGDNSINNQDVVTAGSGWLFQQPTVTAPSGLSGSVDSSTAITWSWTDNSNNETGFRVDDSSNNSKSGDLAAGTTSWQETGLSPNTSYTRHVHGFNVVTGDSLASDNATAVTLSTTPTSSNITASQTGSAWTNNSSFTFTNTIGFGAGNVEYFRYAWDTSSTHAWVGTETQWTSGTLTKTATSDSNSWYLHLKGYDSADAVNGTLDLGPYYYDATAPLSFDLDSPGHESYTSSERPTFRWKTSSDVLSGLSKYRLEVDNPSAGSGQVSGDFAIDNIPTSGTADVTSNRHVFRFENFSDSDSTNNYISVYTKSSNDWSLSENDGKLREGKVTWKIKAIDNAGNETSASRTLYADFTNPSLTSVSADNIGTKDGYVVSATTKPKITGTISDNLMPGKIMISFYKQNFFLGMETSRSLILSEANTLTNTNSATSLAFSLPPSQDIEYGKYRVIVKGIDKAGNNSSEEAFNLQIMTETQAKTLLAFLSEEQKKKIGEQSVVSLPELEKKAILRRQKEASELAKLIRGLSGQVNTIATVIGRSISGTLAFIGNSSSSIFIAAGQGIHSVMVSTSGTTTSAIAYVLNITTNINGAFSEQAESVRTSRLGSLYRDSPVGEINRYVIVSFANSQKEMENKISETSQKTAQSFNSQLAIFNKFSKNQISNVGNIIANANNALADSQREIGKQIAKTHQGTTKRLVAAGRAISLAWHAVYDPAQKITGPFSRLSYGLKIGISNFQAYVLDDNPTMIDGVAIEELGKDYVVISWKTNHYTNNNKVNYGADLGYGEEAWGGNWIKNHLVRITNLKPNQKYYFEVMSQNKNYVYDAYYSFVTKK